MPSLLHTWQVLWRPALVVCLRLEPIRLGQVSTDVQHILLYCVVDPVEGESWADAGANSTSTCILCQAGTYQTGSGLCDKSLEPTLILVFP